MSAINESTDDDKIEKRMEPNDIATGDHIFTFQAPSDIYALAFSRKTPNNLFKFAIGSFKETPENTITIVEHKEEERSFNIVQTISTKFPPTKLQWNPSTSTSDVDILAASSDSVTIYQYEDQNSVPTLKPKACFTNVS